MKNLYNEHIDKNYGKKLIRGKMKLMGQQREAKVGLKKQVNFI